MDQNDRAVVRTAMLASGGVGVPGALAGTDLPAIAAIWAAMTVLLAKQSGERLDARMAFRLMSGLLSGSAAFIGGSKLATSLLNLIPGAGTLTAIGVNCLFNMLYTWRLGNATSNMFRRGSFTSDDVTEAALHSMAIFVPVPRLSEVSEMASLATDTSLDLSGIFEQFIQARKDAVS